MIEGFRRSSTRRSVTGIAAIAVCAALAAVAATAALADPPPALYAGGTQGVVFVHGAHGAGNPHKNRSQQLVYHFGSVMTTGASVKSIFWGSSWNTNSGDKITGLDSFYKGVGGTNYAGTNTEYTQSGGGTVSGSVSYGGSTIDSSTPPTGAPSTSAVLAVVAHNVSNPTTNGYYPVYSERGRGNAGYCAWHSWGYIGNTLVQFAFFFNLDGDPGCNPGTVSGQSQGLTALGNVSGHELSEALTDPHGDAWYDNSGNENADKCAWTFGRNLIPFSNNTSWLIQGNWSNNVYTNGGSYLGAGSGCIDGNNP
jgi:hypothetical protein